MAEEKMEQVKLMAETIVRYTIEAADKVDELAYLCDADSTLANAAFDHARIELIKKHGEGAHAAFLLIHFGLIALNYFRGKVQEADMVEIQQSMNPVMDDLLMWLAPSQGTG